MKDVWVGVKLQGRGGEAVGEETSRLVEKERETGN